MRNKRVIVLSIFALIGILISCAVSATVFQSGKNLASVVMPSSRGSEAAGATSNRVIVELTSPEAATHIQPGTSLKALKPGIHGRLNVASAQVVAYKNQLKAEQNQVMSRIQSSLPISRISMHLNERGVAVENRYTTLFNGMAIEVGNGDMETAMAELRKVPGVKRVYRDRAYAQNMYASLPLINVDAAWNNPAVSGIENAGEGIKVASMDGGVHHESPMFDGTGFEYPEGFGPDGRGDTSNNNGKIIVSRAYFRADDPPRVDPDNADHTDGNVWPGYFGTSHGVHTSGTMVGNPITPAEYLGYADDPPLNISGVAPRAWIMSYRVFYESVSGDQGFYTAEGLAALEDIVADGADVLNNSWGGGPISPGGDADPLDAALINAVTAGIFVSVSAGNEGPGNGTVDHPSDAYISVAASTTSGTLSSGILNVPGAGEDLQGIAYGTADFGGMLESGSTIMLDHLVAAANIDNGSAPGENVAGCSEWGAEIDFAGKTVLIIRGGCNFSDKVRYAQQRGAEFVIIYNTAGNDAIMDMSCGGGCDDITIPAIFIGNSHGTAIGEYITDTWNAALELNTIAFQAGNTPDRIADFSSRGPAVGNVLKPDIAAPGVNILSQGYTPNAVGEDRHFLYGQSSGTSMAAPHVAGAAAVIRQIHPDWPVSYIKSAMMTTSKYEDVYTADGAPAQPLDMGAGRLDLTHVTDPGVILDPVNVSYGLVYMGTKKSITVTARSITDTEETFDLSSVYTGNGFDALSCVAGITIRPESITLPAGGTAEFTVTFNSVHGLGLGENQGYIVLQGNQGHTAHMPAWARVITTAEADVLLIDNDFSTLSPTSFQEGNIEQACADYQSYYTTALDELGISYDVWDTDKSEDPDSSIPEASRLLGYKAVIYFTGDNYYPFSPAIDMDRLTEYANSGGILIAMGQDLSRVVGFVPDVSGDTPFFFADILGGEVVSDLYGSIIPTPEGADPVLPDHPILPAAGSPSAFANISLDLSANASGDGAKNQFWIDELSDIPNTDLTHMAPELMPFTLVLHYPREDNVENGGVAMLHRDTVALNHEHLLFTGRTVYTSFGLEGVNNLPGSTSRAELLRTFMNWAQDEPVASIEEGTSEDGKTAFVATLISNMEGAQGIGYRWDFGDGSEYESTADNAVTHAYTETGTYTVRVEITDSWGNRAIASMPSTGEPSESSNRGGGNGGPCFISTVFE